MGERGWDLSFFDSVSYAVIHSTKPDRRRIYDGGDWGGDFAGYPLPLALMARLSLLLGDSKGAQFARFYIYEFAVPDRFNSITPLVALLYLDSTAPRLDFTQVEPLSYYAAGTGLITYRSSWSDKAFWGSFQGGSPHFANHQNFDQGAVTLDYLGLALLVDAGMWREPLPGGKAINNYAGETKWHNTIFIDDLGRETGLSQGAYGTPRTLAFEDAGAYVYARTDLTGAYAYYPWRKDSDDAKLVTRDIFYLRPSVVLFIDEVEPLAKDYPRGLLFHFPFAAKTRLENDTLSGQRGAGGLSSAGRSCRRRRG